MTESLFDDGYLPDPENTRSQLAMTQEPLALPSGFGDVTSVNSISSSIQDPSRREQQPDLPRSAPELRPTEEEEEEKQADDSTVTATELEETSLPQSATLKSIPLSTTMPTFPEPVSKSETLASQQQGPASTQAQAQSSRRTASTTTPNQRIRHTPRLPNHNADKIAPSTIPYWSRAPVYGHLPTRCMRAHTITLVDNVAWQIGGCDHQSCSREVLTFDTETMQWAHPETVGDQPPPCRAHSATQVDRRIFVFGGGEGPTYYNHLHVLDTAMRRWSKATFLPNTSEPIPRRAHATWYYQGKIYLFGGGNGARALNDLWTFDVGLGPPYDKMRWEAIDVKGPKPSPRGYHTANLINNSVVVIGGSDGSACFEDVWVLNLEKLFWQEIKLDMPIKRLSHTSTQVGSYLFVMGGHDGSKYNHDLQLFNLVTLQWEQKETRGRYPSSRGYHATILSDSRLFVIGGFDGHTVFDDVFILDLAAAAYLPQVKSFDLTLN